MHKPELKTPPPPEIAYLDLDMPIFSAASACQQIWYVAKTPAGDEVARFDSAAAYKNWVELSQEFGFDIEHGFDGDWDSLERHVEYDYKDINHGYKALDNIIESWVLQSGCKDWVGYVSKQSGARNFRYDVSTYLPYKGNRKNDLPKYLEDIRRYARKHPNIKIAYGNWEVDDVTCALAQKKKWRGCVVSGDKDARGVNNTHFLIPDQMPTPQFSSSKIVGRLWLDGKEVRGYGWLWWLWQSCSGDPVDNIRGIDGVGKKGAYNLLQEFDEVDIKYLEDAVQTVLAKYQEVYGDEYKYTHCWTGEDVIVTGADLMKENLQLVYMLKNRSDVCPLLEMV